MKTFTFLGVRLLSERSWNATIDDAARERALRLEREEQLRVLDGQFRKMAKDGEDFATFVEEAMAEKKAKDAEITANVETVVRCNHALMAKNVRLAFRAEQAELAAVLLQERLAEQLEKP